MMMKKLFCDTTHVRERPEIRGITYAEPVHRTRGDNGDNGAFFQQLCKIPDVIKVAKLAIRKRNG